MKRITVITFGKLKVPGLSDCGTEYQKRISRYVDLTLIELKPVKILEKSELLRQQVLAKEAALILDSIQQCKSKGPIWVLDETGTGMPTRDWATHFTKIEQNFSGELICVIGGSLGLDESILKISQKKISLGPQTFTHELARIVLLEQLYRVLSLNAGHPYHNEG
jgi:23S rRNA (pseudouridine1915-N3)-methyltransferase